MNLLELHILQSFPVTCLNRDDVGAPKTAVFGGAPRARVSSQCWKRAIRKLAKERTGGDIERPGDGDGPFGGFRGHYVAERLEAALAAEKLPAKKAKELAEEIAKHLGSKDAKHKGEFKTAVALYLSSGEVVAIAKAAAADLGKSKKIEIKKGAIKKALDDMQPVDVADIAIFGRMVASDHTLMLEGAGMFSHALSTHRVSNEVDFFSAIDELKAEESEGAGHIGTLEFNSACYYRYVGLNVDLLRDTDHLGRLAEDDLKRVVDTFLRASVESVPEARHNSMFGHNPPGFVLGLARKGQPLSLANAFEAPVTSGKGYLDKSREALEAHWSSLKTTYGIDAIELRLPESSLDKFVEGMVGHA